MQGGEVGDAVKLRRSLARENTEAVIDNEAKFLPEFDEKICVIKNRKPVFRVFGFYLQ